MSQSEKLLLQALAGKAGPRPPIWMMRQAGRFLPEYREVRATTSSFLEFCYTPEKAIEVTLQPIRRFGFDASIMFADILVIPDALGQKVAFEENVGPVLEPVGDGGAVARLSMDKLHEHLAPVYETLKGLSGALPSDVTLIGFAGAPWTVATYMVGGKGSPTQAAARLLAYREPETFQALIDLLVEATASYLIAQVEAGAEVLQLFDTWAGSLAPTEFEKWCVAPTKRIVEAVRAVHPDVPIIGFPKGVGSKAIGFLRATGVQGISVDTGTDMAWARQELSPLATVQGNLDPLALVAGGAALDRATDELLEGFAGKPYIFNLGHGIEKETPPDHVAQVVRRVQA
ncbi:MAG: uroporphyrinogen decarboxylase [Alphaproteobacteria bacterium]|nr:MAG: uroporphyrinogen decarboxylase [Alphaproteobacteria bacterium]